MKLLNRIGERIGKCIRRLKYLTGCIDCVLTTATLLLPLAISLSVPMMLSGYSKSPITLLDSLTITLQYLTGLLIGLIYADFTGPACCRAKPKSGERTGI